MVNGVHMIVKALITHYGLPMSEGLAGFVARRRSELGLTQEGLAERAGVSRDIVAGIESGKSKRPEPENRRRIAAALGLRHVDLLVATGDLLPDEIADTAPRWPRDDPDRVRLWELIEALPKGALAYTLRTLGLIRDARW